MRPMQGLRRVFVLAALASALFLAGCSGGSTTINRIAPTSTAFPAAPPVVTQGLGPSLAPEAATEPEATSEAEATPVP